MAAYRKSNKRQPELTEFAAKLQQRREEMRYSIAELSRATGISISAMNNYLYHGVKPRREKVLALARVLECDPDWLLATSGNRDSIPRSDEATVEQMRAIIFRMANKLPLEDVSLLLSITAKMYRDHAAGESSAEPVEEE